MEFRLGEIEHLPVADGAVDIILSNCVVNLSPDKAQVFREAYRVLKPGGRLSIADIVAISPMPEDLRNDLALVTGCIAGAATKEELEEILGEGRVCGNKDCHEGRKPRTDPPMGPGAGRRPVHRLGHHPGSQTVAGARPDQGTCRQEA